MNKYIAAFAGLLFVSFSCYALESQFLGYDESFAVDVPEGWSINEVKHGIQLVSDDHKNSLSVIVGKNGGLTARDLSEKLIKHAGISTSRIDCRSDNACNVYTTTEKNISAKTTLTTEGGSFVSITQSGDDKKTLAQIIDSLR